MGPNGSNWPHSSPGTQVTGKPTYRDLTSRKPSELMFFRFQPLASIPHANSVQVWRMTAIHLVRVALDIDLSASLE